MRDPFAGMAFGILAASLAVGAALPPPDPAVITARKPPRHYPVPNPKADKRKQAAVRAMQERKRKQRAGLK